MTRRASIAVLLGAISCRTPKQAAVEDLSTHENLAAFRLGSLRGTRDGDRLHAAIMFTDSSSILTLDLQFAVGSPTRLDSGTWRWTRNNGLNAGSVIARSVTFLGGQDGPPSIGGTFDLITPDGVAAYRVTLPTMELKSRL